MTYRLKVISLIVFCLMRSNELLGQNTVEEKIWKIIELTDTKASFESTLNKLIEIQQSSATSPLSDEYYELFKSIMKVSFDTEILEGTVQFYKDNFTENEINEILSFYESEVGAKMIRVLPKLLDYAMVQGGRLGDSISTVAYDSTQLLMKNRFEYKSTGCAYAKTGKFEYDLNGLKYSIEREKEKQREITETHTNDLRINWVDDCKYEITLISTTDPNTNVSEFPVLVFNIISGSDSGYTYVGKPKGVDFFFQGYLKRVN